MTGENGSAKKVSASHVEDFERGLPNPGCRLAQGAQPSLTRDSGIVKLGEGVLGDVHLPVLARALIEAVRKMDKGEVDRLCQPRETTPELGLGEKSIVAGLDVSRDDDRKPKAVNNKWEGLPGVASAKAPVPKPSDMA